MSEPEHTIKAYGTFRLPPGVTQAEAERLAQEADEAEERRRRKNKE
jgi:hypothetical protein